MKPAIRIKTVKHKNSGKSFFGGLPKLPANFEWPFWDATPLYLDEIKYAEKLVVNVVQQTTGIVR